MIDLAQLDVGSPASYLIAVLVPALDALIPVLPSETAVIALGVATAGSADPRIAVLVALAAFGAFLGDNAAYLRRFGPAVAGGSSRATGAPAAAHGPSAPWTSTASGSSLPAGSSRAAGPR